MAKLINKNNFTISIVSIITMSILFMEFVTWGSYNPGDFGFWLAIINAILVQLFVNFMFSKFWIPDNKK